MKLPNLQIIGERITKNPLYDKVTTNVYLQLACLLMLVLVLEIISFLSYKFAFYPGIPLPGSFLLLLIKGYFWPVLLAFVFFFAPVLSAILWYLGGEKRAVGVYILSGLIGLILTTSFALYIFCYWEKLHLMPYPWLVFGLFQQLPKGSAAYNHLVVSLAGSYMVLAIMLLLPVFSYKTKAEKIFGKAHFASGLEIKKAGLFAETGIVLGKTLGKVLRLPGFESVLIVAPTGSGKTTAIAVPNLVEWQGSVVINDLKGELYKLTAHFRKEVMGDKCIKWAPADETMDTFKYNPFFYVSDNPNLRIRDLQLIAETIIPQERGHDGRFWYTSSREIFIMLALYLFEKKGIPTLAEINDLSRTKEFFGWLSSVITEGKIKEEIFYQYAHSLLIADKEKARPNILKDFHSRMSLFVDPVVRNATSGNDFDFRTLRKEKVSIYISIGESDMKRLSPILTLFWAQFINAMASHEPDLKVEPHPVLAVLDEFGNMERIKKLQQGTTFMRSYRLRCLFIVQYLAQIVSAYGRDDARAFINSKVRLIHALNDTEDAKLFADALGHKTVRVNSSSVNSGSGDHGGGRSSSTSYQSRLLVTPDEILQMPKAQEIILLEAHSPIKAKKIPWFKDRNYKKILAPYLPEDAA